MEGHSKEPGGGRGEGWELSLGGPDMVNLNVLSAESLSVLAAMTLVGSGICMVLRREWNYTCCCEVASVMADSVRPHNGSPPGSPVPGILQARTLEWVTC